MGLNFFLIATVIKWGLLINTCFLVIAYWLKTEWRSLTKQWLYAGNFITLIYILVSESYRIYDLFVTDKLQEEYNFYYALHYTVYFYGCLFCIAVLLLSFWLKRLGFSFVCSIVALLLLFYEELNIALLSFAKDYVPSSWSVYYHFPVINNQYIFSFIVFNMLVAFVYFINGILAARKKKFQPKS